ncbi:MAG: 16S ribosomal RNA methyltransferase A [Methanoregulaceae archaeon]|nr:16S ribosomal RNA methyltransferase A [Methanoregulaceae archaeon]
MRAVKDQHFLIDERAVRRIVGLIDVRDRVVLEIGPGSGALTRALLDSGALVRAVEIDAGLVEELGLIFADEIEEGRLEVICGDAVRCDLPPFELVVSNLPYSASSRITFRLLDAGFEEAVLMYQAEFAQRMVAPAGTPDCGRLSIMIQTTCCVERCFDLSPQCFSPRPQVRSTVVRIVPRGPIFQISDRQLYADVVRALFSHRRKTVRNCLRNSRGILRGEDVELMLSALPEEILSSRPEALYLEDFATITNVARQ